MTFDIQALGRDQFMVKLTDGITSVMVWSEKHNSLDEIWSTAVKSHFRTDLVASRYCMDWKALNKFERQKKLYKTKEHKHIFICAIYVCFILWCMFYRLSDISIWVWRYGEQSHCMDILSHCSVCEGVWANYRFWIFYICTTWPDCKLPSCVNAFRLNSLAPGRFQRNFRKVIFQLILVIDGWSKIVLKWMPMDFTDGRSTLVQVMAWCRQATSH